MSVVQANLVINTNLSAILIVGYNYNLYYNKVLKPT